LTAVRWSKWSTLFQPRK